MRAKRAFLPRFIANSVSFERIQQLRDSCSDRHNMLFHETVKKVRKDLKPEQDKLSRARGIQRRQLATL
jgi:hypothetical protein